MYRRGRVVDIIGMKPGDTGIPGSPGQFNPHRCLGKSDADRRGSGTCEFTTVDIPSHRGHWRSGRAWRRPGTGSSRSGRPGTQGFTSGISHAREPGAQPSQGPFLPGILECRAGRHSAGLAVIWFNLMLSDGGDTGAHSGGFLVFWLENEREVSRIHTDCPVNFRG